MNGAELARDIAAIAIRNARRWECRCGVRDNLMIALRCYKCGQLRRPVRDIHLPGSGQELAPMPGEAAGPEGPRGLSILLARAVGAPPTSGPDAVTYGR